MLGKSVIVIASLLAVAVYVPDADALSCYKCAWTEKHCATGKLASNISVVTCGPSNAVKFADPVTPAPAPGASTGAAAATTAGAGQSTKPAGGSTKPAGASTKPSGPSTTVSPGGGNKTYHCYRVTVKDDKDTWVERGCKETTKTDDCVKIDTGKNPKAKVDKCTVCEADKCNDGLKSGAPSVAGLSVQCALLSAALIARLFNRVK